MLLRYRCRYRLLCGEISRAKISNIKIPNFNFETGGLFQPHKDKNQKQTVRPERPRCHFITGRLIAVPKATAVVSFG